MKSNLVLIHGFLEDRTMWDGLCSFLEAKPNAPKIWRYDLPAHGTSPALEVAHTMEAFAHFIAEKLDRDGVDDPIWIGHSMGGYVGLAFAELFPNRLKGLMLFHSTAHADSEAKVQERIKAADLVRRSARLFIEMAIHNLFAPYNHKRMQSAIEDAIGQALLMEPEGIAKTLLGMRLRPDRVEVFKQAPYAAVVGGVDDPVIPFARERATYENSKIVVHWLEHCGHMGHLERTDEAFRVIQEWVFAISNSESNPSK